MAITRAATALSARRDQLSACPSFTAAAGERSTTVTATVRCRRRRWTPTTALQWTKRTSTSSGANLRSLTLAAQVGDVRGGGRVDDGKRRRAPDTQSLDTLFTDAVLKVRRGGQP